MYDSKITITITKCFDSCAHGNISTRGSMLIKSFSLLEYISSLERTLCYCKLVVCSCKYFFEKYNANANVTRKLIIIDFRGK